MAVAGAGGIGYHESMSAVIFRKSPIVMVRNLIAFQFCAVGLYLLAGSLMYYAQLWRSLPMIAGYIPFEVAQMALILLAEVFLVFGIFFLWYRETVRLQKADLIYDEGLFVRRHTVVPLNRVVTAAYESNIFSRLTNYGTVILRSTDGAVLLRLTHMQDPAQMVTQLHRPPSDARDAEPLRLVGEAEHATLERKATFRWDLATKKPNRALEKATMKTIAAFMNTDGGNLLLGVADDGSAFGLSDDMATLARRDIDGFENHFSNVLSAMIGSSFRQHVQVRPFEYQGKPCVLVSVDRSTRPAFVVDGGAEEFFVRTGNGTSALRVSEALAYITDRFPSST